MKCQACHEQQAEWAWMPFGPDESPDSFSLLGSHIRGFPVVKVCSSCKQAFQSGDFVVKFQYKGHDFIAEEHQVREVGASLWLGETYLPSELNDAHVQAIMRDTATKGIDVAALVYVDNADLIPAFLAAPGLMEACQELDKHRDKIKRWAELSYVDNAERDAVLMALARMHTMLDEEE
jgi:hypothetical protein